MGTARTERCVGCGEPAMATFVFSRTRHCDDCRSSGKFKYDDNDDNEEQR